MNLKKSNHREKLDYLYLSTFVHHVIPVKQLKNKPQEFPGGPEVRAWCFNCCGLGQALVRELRSISTSIDRWLLLWIIIYGRHQVSAFQTAWGVARAISADPRSCIFCNWFSVTKAWFLTCFYSCEVVSRDNIEQSPQDLLLSTRDFVRRPRGDVARIDPAVLEPPSTFVVTYTLTSKP